MKCFSIHLWKVNVIIIKQMKSALIAIHQDLRTLIPNQVFKSRKEIYVTLYIIS